MKAEKNGKYTSSVSALLYSFIDFFLSLTGFCLVLFIILHLLMDASILISHDLFNSIAVFLDKYYLADAGVPLVVTGLIVHVICSLFKQMGNFIQKSLLPLKRKLHFETLLYYVQIFTGLCMLFLASFHVIEMIFSNVSMINSVTSSVRFSTFHRRVYYSALMSTTVLHTSIGIYRLYAKWIGKKRYYVFCILSVFFVMYFSISSFAIFEFSKSADIAQKVINTIRINGEIGHELKKTALKKHQLSIDNPIIQKIQNQYDD